MTIDAARRVDIAVRDDWDARMQAHESRVAAHDEVHVDADRQTVSWLRGGALVLEAPIELIGVFFPDLGLFRWWWSGKEHAIHLTPSRLDEAFAHAQRSDLRALLTRQHQLDGEPDVAMLCRIAAYFAHATAIVRDQTDDRVSFYAVFGATRTALPDRDIVRTLPPPAVAMRQSHAAMPAVTIETSSEPRVVREPARDLLLPMVHVAHGLVTRAFPDRAQRALVIVNVDSSRDKVRFFTTLVASTTDGDLAAVDTTRDLLDAAGTMLAEDARSGNGRWRKLVVRIDFEGSGAAISRCDVMI